MGGSPSPQVPQSNPRAEAEARDWEAQQQAARDRTNQEAADAKQAIKDRDTLDRWQGGRTNAYLATQDYGRGKLASYGLSESNDPYNIWGSFVNKLDRNNMGIQENADYSSALGTNVFDNALNDARSGQRNKLAKGYNTQLGTDYFDNAFNSTADDSILEGILGNQYNEAQTSLQNAYGRGQMNNAAYSKALDTLDKTKGTARASLQKIGQGVLDSDKAATQKYSDSTLGRANNFDFGDTFDIGSEVGKTQNKAKGYLDSLSTDINTAVGDQSFFDPSSIIAKSVASGGVNNYNPAVGATSGSTSNPLYNVFDDQARKKQTEGVF